MRIVSWRRRTSTVSSATRRWPRTIRSSAHSLLPMPLSPAISTPRPRTSISTACSIVRSASESSSIDDSLAIAVGVDDRRSCSSGSRARADSARSSAGGAKPPVIRTHGKSTVSERRSDVDARGGVEAFEIADLALAEDQDASRPEVLVEAGEREAGLLDVRAGDDRDRGRRARPAARAAGRTLRDGCRAASRRSRQAEATSSVSSR